MNEIGDKEMALRVHGKDEKRAIEHDTMRARGKGIERERTREKIMFCAQRR